RLTPKLLSGLTFNEKVTVLCVHNGPTMKNAQSWDVDKFLKSKNLL
uniref:Uncharacterized protein n=1 Tax=Acrobeloides nanus TaxID=290746 RepID=A0A914DN48_9BILA